MTGNEVRQNKATKEWVIYAPGRGDRPHDYSTKKAKDDIPPHDKNCPFCPGNEEEISQIIMELPNKGNNKWQTRVIPNKFPVLKKGIDMERKTEGIYVTMHGYGLHEVIIETPLHNRGIAKMNYDEVSAVIETYHKRYVDVMKDHHYMMPILFRNHGQAAGTSLVHPHSQFIVTNFVPRHIRQKEEEAQEYYDEWKKCVVCEMLQYELKERKRIIQESENFAAYVPFAAEVPFEINIVPKVHKADFGEINDKEKSEFARILKDVLHLIYAKLDNPDYNYIINTAPRYKADEPHLHWFLQIRPRLVTRAGFEIGSGISINPTLPENNAEFLLKKN